MKRLVSAVREALSLGIIAPIPPGMVADSAAMFGLSRLASNVNLYSEAIVALTTAGTNSNVTAAQLLAGVLKLNAGASGGFTITLPSTAAIIAAMGPTVMVDGTFSMPISIENNNVGQTGTVTAGDVSTTLTGTMTIATNTRRLFVLTVTGTGTITIENVGSVAL